MLAHKSHCKASKAKIAVDSQQISLMLIERAGPSAAWGVLSSMGKACKASLSRQHFSPTSNGTEIPSCQTGDIEGYISLL